ncbi:hypothetical protein GCM10023063_45660 [Arthrobacter methylotrophus]|uniref:hypothetical protein n=1 Tax=Arthrobacter methylotrophus TaxID=121291 RepID=UPI0031EC0AD5
MTTNKLVDAGSGIWCQLESGFRGAPNQVRQISRSGLPRKSAENRQGGPRTAPLTGAVLLTGGNADFFRNGSSRSYFQPRAFDADNGRVVSLSWGIG